MFLAITAHLNPKSLLISWIVFANSESVEPVVITSLTNKMVALFGTEINLPHKILTSDFSFSLHDLDVAEKLYNSFLGPNLT